MWCNNCIFSLKSSCAKYDNAVFSLKTRLNMMFNEIFLIFRARYIVGRVLESIPAAGGEIRLHP